MKMYLFLFVLSLALCQEVHWVEYQNYNYVLKKGTKQSAVALAWGYYKHEVEKNGWGKLYIWTSSTFTSHEYSLKTNYAAGFLEAALTWPHIYDHYKSWFDYTFPNGAQPTQQLVDFMWAQDKYTRKLINDHPFDEYYQSLARITAQNDGLYAGIAQFATADKKLSLLEVLYLQACGDLYDIIPATQNPAQRIQWDALSQEDFEWEREKLISCSALIKAAEGWTDVYVSHTTWTSYQNMLRIYKFYSFTGPKPYRVNFASKPGLLYSKDDFYVLPDARLVVLETTNSLFATDLFDKVIPESLLTWQRVPMAHSLSKGGRDWTTVFLRHNSGTYNNQYMVVDYKTFSAGNPPKSDFLWISETMPGMGMQQDVTSVVLAQDNHWPSYNIPFIPEVYVYAGFEAQKAKVTDPDSVDYKNCPRGKLFAKHHKTVTDLESMKAVIRRNDFQNEQESQNDPGKAIANRSDLRPTNPKAFGAIDAKIASKSHVINNGALIQSGPTTYNGQPAFQWSKWNQPSIHLGQPDLFNFDFIEAMIEQP